MSVRLSGCFRAALLPVLLLAAASALADDAIELRNWTAPPYWAPHATDIAEGPAAVRKDDGRAGRETLALPSAALPFIAIPPCRIADTRDGSFPANFGPPSLVGGATGRTFVIPSGPCPGLPADAGAWSLNFTVVAPPGTPPGGYLSVWPTGGTQPIVSTLNFTSNSILANAAVVPAGTGGGINVFVNFSTDLIIDINGYYSGAGVVTALNTLTGDVTLSPGSNVTITPSGNTLTIAAAGGGGGGGTVTSVGTGGGLTGGPITITGTISVAPLGITSSMLAPGAVGLSKIDTSQVQARVTSTCPAGSTIQSIGPDGSVVCTAAAPQAGFTLSTLDSAGNVGNFSSLAIGTDGLGLISYRDSANSSLKVAHCSNTACTAATLSTLDSPGDTGYTTSVAIGADGLGLISYYDGTNKDLKVAHCSNVACTSATLSTLDSAGDVGYSTSVTIGSDGLGLISYFDYTNGDLKVAHCSNVNCSAATLSTLDSVGETGWWSSITIGADGLGLISYWAYSGNDLKVAHCSNVNCSAATLSTPDNGGVGQYSSITIGSDGLGLISYWDQGVNALKVAHCSNADCTSSAFSTLDSMTIVGKYTSITVGGDGLGLISYFDDTNDAVKVAHCSNVACTSATLSSLDGGSYLAFATSIAIGSDGFGLISYFGTDSDLKVAHCSNALCTPYVRRR
jgi:hypothetical protein